MSLYKLARKILPLSIQAWLGNRHKVKRYTLDPLLFNFTSHHYEERLHYRKCATEGVSVSMLEENPHIPLDVAASYRKWYAGENVEQVVRVRGEVFIEPRAGWPMGRTNQLYLSLHPCGHSPYMPVPEYKAIFNKKPRVMLDKVINLRDVNENGYSHFYTDLMAKLLIVKHAGLNLKDYTAVISKKVAETPYGSFMLKHSPLFAELGDIFLQDKEFVSCNEAVFASALVNPVNNPENFKEIIRYTKAASVPATDTGERKVFLTRGANRRRTMRNGSEIAEILKARGFECVDADGLSLPEQIDLFTNCRILVGIHGAGLINTLYRSPKKLSLFEIREPSHAGLPLFGGYHNMAVALGFDYGAVSGEAFDPETQSFYMPPERFTAAIDAFLATAPS